MCVLCSYNAVGTTTTTTTTTTDDDDKEGIDNLSPKDTVRM